jgi:hypothetical protein
MTMTKNLAEKNYFEVHASVLQDQNPLHLHHRPPLHHLPHRCSPPKPLQLSFSPSSFHLLSQVYASQLHGQLAVLELSLFVQQPYWKVQTKIYTAQNRNSTWLTG